MDWVHFSLDDLLTVRGVVVAALEGGGALQSINGRIAVGRLIVEDLATVLVKGVSPSWRTRF